MLCSRLGRHGAFPDRKSTRLNSSHSQISYAVFCLKKKKPQRRSTDTPPRDAFVLGTCLTFVRDVVMLVQSRELASFRRTVPLRSGFLRCTHARSHSPGSQRE